MDIKERVDSLTQYLNERQEYVVSIYNKKRIQEGNPYKSGLISFHNTIGSKNNTFIDSVRMQFANPEDYIAHWLDGLCEQYKDKRVYNKSGILYIILEMLKDRICKEYIYTFLERSFYRHIEAMMREKPRESLWEVWFGRNPLFWGLFITPVNRKGIWTNDVSEIRRTSFNYWTIGHILSTGIVDTENNKLVGFSSFEKFSDFYLGILKRTSASKYEKELMDCYFEYLYASGNPSLEPLLIPEFRYAGKDKEHKYRLDFTILNAYKKQCVGIELSPQSTHMKVDKIAGKTQNQELGEKWGKEMKKRNEYFQEYGITTLTFTDDELQNIKNCFSMITPYLSDRGNDRVILGSAEEKLYAIIK